MDGTGQYVITQWSMKMKIENKKPKMVASSWDYDVRHSPQHDSVCNFGVMEDE